MTALALILCAAIAAMGVLVIVSPARANDLTRLFAEKTGLWVATAIRAGLGLGLLAAAGDSKAPVLLPILGGLILIVAIARPLLGLHRHQRMLKGCLPPARSPYDAQYLPETDAVRERKRCEAVRNRIAQLREALV